MLKGKMGLKACGLTSAFLSCINLIKLAWFSCRHLTPKKSCGHYMQKYMEKGAKVL